jgi:hypothetical protein
MPVIALHSKEPASFGLGEGQYGLQAAIRPVSGIEWLVYAAIAEGSSSAAPVMTPGPSVFATDRAHQDLKVHCQLDLRSPWG